MKTTVTNPAEADRIVRARIQLLIHQPWFGSLALNLRVVEDTRTTTMATDGTRLLYNPTWTATQPDDVLAGTIAHEAMHCGLRHIFRCQGRDLKLWNAAADYAINPLLLSSDLRLPDGILNDAAYHGMPAETVYAKLLHAQQEEQRQRQEDQEKRDQEEQQEEDDDQGEGDQEDDGDSEEEGDDTQDSNDQDDNAEDDNAENDTAGQGDGAAAGPDDLLPAPETTSGASAGVDDDEPALTEIDWQIIAEQASMVAAKRGLMPADAERAFQETLTPKVDWRTVLRRFVEQTMPSDYSWSQPNRRYAAQGLYLPSVVKENCPRLVVALDTSGSIDQRLLDTFAAELTAIMQEVRPSAIDVVSCDARVQQVETFIADDGAIILHPKGGGGTAFQPLFDWVEEQDEPPAAIVYLTDLDGDEPTEPSVSVLWVTPEHVTREGRFGETIRMPS